MPEAQNTQPPAGGNPADQTTGSKNGNETPKTYSEEQVSEIVQKRVNELNAKHEKDIGEKLKAAEAEWNRKAKLTEEQRAEEARKEAQEKFDNEKSDFLREKAEFVAEKELSGAGIPAEFKRFVLGENDDQTKQNVKDLKSFIDKAVEEGVKAKTKSGTPSDKGTRTNIGKEGSKIGIISGAVTSF